MKKINLFLLMLLCTAFNFNTSAQSGANDASFNSGTGASSAVWTSAVKSDGKIIIGGYFSSYNGTASSRVACLNADGSFDGTFIPGTGASGLVRTCAIQNDGKIIIGGEFLSYNGTTKNRIARLNTNGTLDGTFASGTGAGDWVYAIAIQSNGKILIGGNFGTFNGTARNKIARLNTDGTLDLTFTIGTGANLFVWTIAIQSDGKIIISGNFTTFNGTARNGIARLNADGTLDGTFNPGTGSNGLIRTTAIQSDGKIIIGGDFTTYNGTNRNHMARLNTDGSLDGSFNPGSGADDNIRTCALQSDGKIVIGGDFTTFNGTNRSRIARLNNDGSIDGTFNPGAGANDIIRTTALQSDGKIIIGGDFSSYDGTSRNNIARLNGGAGGVGINEDNVDQSYFNAYPNPSNGTYFIESSFEQAVILINILGEQVKILEILKGQNEIDLTDLPLGVYFVNVKSEYFTKTLRLIKE